MNYKNYFILFIILLFTFSYRLSAQPGWIQNYQPFYTPYYDYDYETGNIIVMDDGSFVVNRTCLEYDPDMGYYSNFGYLIKFDPEGNFLWAKKDSLSSSPDMWDCESETFAILPDGGIVSAGEKGFDPAYLYFRNSNGVYENVVYYYNNFNYHTVKVVDGNSLLLGGYSSDKSGAFLQKTNLSGEQVWVRDYSDFCSSIESIVEAFDGGYALGCFRSNNYQLVKTDTAGTVEWYKSYDYNSQADFINSMIGTSDGGYLLCGYTDHNPGTDGDGGFIVKTDSVGDTLWTRKYERSYCARVWCATTSNNKIVLHGYSNNGIIILFKIDNFGDEVWYKEISVIGYTTAEQNMQLCDNGFIIYLEGDVVDDDIVLIKTDENGNVAIDEEIIQPINTMLCHPNPFHSHMTISYLIETPSTISINIYNIKGQVVKELQIDNIDLGINEVMWDGNNSNGMKVASGIYFCVIKDGKNEVVRKMVKITSP